MVQPNQQQRLDVVGKATPAIVAPKPVTNAEATKALAALLDKPAVLPVPKFALRVALGGFAQEVTMSQGVAPEVLTKAGFQWQHPTIEQALAAMQP